MNQRPFQLPDNEYTFEDHWFDYRDCAMHYIDVPSATSSSAPGAADQPTIIMLHGNPTWSYLYRRVIPALNGQYRCIAPDYPGFGFSGHPTGYSYSPKEQADSVLALIDHLQLKRYVLMIQDWGGPIGIEVATRHPERVAGLVIANTWSWRADLLLTLFSKILGGPLGKYLILQHNLFANKFMQSALEQNSSQPDSILAAYRDPFPTPASRTGTWIFPKAISGEGDWLRSLEQKLPLLSGAPVELVWGMQDPIMARDKVINRWLKHFPQAGLTKVENAGHFLQETAYEELAQATLRVLSE